VSFARVSPTLYIFRIGRLTAAEFDGKSEEGKRREKKRKDG